MIRIAFIVMFGLIVVGCTTTMNKTITSESLSKNNCNRITKNLLNPWGKQQYFCKPTWFTHLKTTPVENLKKRGPFAGEIKSSQQSFSNSDDSTLTNEPIFISSVHYELKKTYIPFAVNSSKAGPVAKKIINNIISELKNNGFRGVLTIGGCMRSTEFNHSLPELRNENVKVILEANGLDSVVKTTCHNNEGRHAWIQS